MSDPIYLNNVRLSFPHLTAPHSPNPNAEKKYQADFIMPEDHPGWAEIMRRVQEVAQQKWGEHAQAVMQHINNDKRLRCYGNGNEKTDRNMQPYDGYAGNMYFAGKNKNMPIMIKPDGTPVDAANQMESQALARKLYGGCYVNAAVDIYPQDDQNGRGIRGGLMAVQFLRDGESFGAGVPNLTGFGAVKQAASGPTPGGMATPNNAQPFGQPKTAPSSGMPAAPFSEPGKPDWM